MQTLTSSNKFTKEDVRAWLSPDSIQAGPMNAGSPFVSLLSKENLQ